MMENEDGYEFFSDGVMDEASIDRMIDAMPSQGQQARKNIEEFRALAKSGLRRKNKKTLDPGSSCDEPSHLPIHVSGPLTGYVMVEFDYDVITIDKLSDRQYHGERWLGGTS